MDDNNGKSEYEFDFLTDIDFVTILDKPEPEPPADEIKSAPQSEQEPTSPEIDAPRSGRRNGRYVGTRYRKQTAFERMNIFSGLFSPVGKFFKKIFSWIGSKLDPLAEFLSDKWDSLTGKKAGSGRLIEFFDPVADLMCDGWDRLCGRKVEKDHSRSKKELIAPLAVLIILLAVIIIVICSTVSCIGKSCSSDQLPQSVSSSDISESDASLSNTKLENDVSDSDINVSESDSQKGDISDSDPK